MKNNKGFSLVELIVVIAIMAILAAVAIPTFATFINKANVASDESYLNDLEYAVELALTAEGEDYSDYKLTVTVGANNAITYEYAKDADNKHTFTTEQNADIAATVELTHKFASEKGEGTWARDNNGKWDFTPKSGS